ncbi:hypothetical protein PR048_027447 [Dryococelus australis]|uniref:Tc1-like transposase DDE domain-containing protein n=1 Tax=Dryococelus australis TaxID=614101 RepID=A0ABQ9GFS1_9NEOP|nr:hypothetical protein PR048_027447 [Dryococelus australis]
MPREQFTSQGPHAYSRPLAVSGGKIVYFCTAPLKEQNPATRPAGETPSWRPPASGSRYHPSSLGAAVVYESDQSPPPHLGEPGSIPGGAASIDRAGRCLWWTGFLGDLPFSPVLAFRLGTAKATKFSFNRFLAMFRELLAPAQEILEPSANTPRGLFFFFLPQKHTMIYIRTASCWSQTFADIFLPTARVRPGEAFEFVRLKYSTPLFRSRKPTDHTKAERTPKYAPKVRGFPTPYPKQLTASLPIRVSNTTRIGFQDDNARCHVSRTTMQWYADNNVRRLDWPAHSSDLNPIEHLRDELDRRVRARKARPKSIAQLMEWLQEEWRRIPGDILQTLVESMPVRVAAVIAARGGPTRF